MDMVIQTTGLCKKYNDILRVKDLDLAVPVGSVYGFLGPNGAGKTTTIKMLLGLVKPTAGSIRVFGCEVNRQNRIDILKNIGALVEAPSYYSHLTGEENLRIVQTLKEVPEKEIDRVLHIVRLENHRKKLVGQYSLGMRQRLGLAFALLGSPKMLILDEPTNGLDPAGIQEIRDLIRSLPIEYGMTVLVSSHLLSEIDQMSTFVGIINKGELIFQESMMALHERSQQKIALRTINNRSVEAILQEKGIRYEESDGFLLLPKLDDEMLAHFVTFLISRQVGLVRLEERKKSLEDIFLELTGTAVSL
ncbi:ATP-binding cassette domain-containing protein [Leptolinea tardivitalis]|uniref:Bacitracin ABC transporter ATP-binding protein n=1 Tax=Leptolinea tardivitalis TaxID=229920 RepID=A0A0P6XN70_9CHLR|nr:ATP-binding cassette domain-containing protein [Leptolinea tardivitalis]KPL70403.1 bacitracin ABC transporter ATP-binding protein [Leptolinea tardivitalis]GAP21972.1 ABC-type multidrug transport system, ATPase component [Leptolinea tardivitalis]